MKLHVLKIKDEYYKEVRSGRKTFELREDDRNYQVGDLIHFVEVNGLEIDSESDNLYEITYVLRDVPQYGLPYGYAILAIRRATLIYETN